MHRPENWDSLTAGYSLNLGVKILLWYCTFFFRDAKNCTSAHLAVNKGLILKL